MNLHLEDTYRCLVKQKFLLDLFKIRDKFELEIKFWSQSFHSGKRKFETVAV
jgi:hypothetical protein